MLYAVCTHCSFLRAYSASAARLARPDSCPACGHDVVLHRYDARFPPTYVSRVSRELRGAPVLGSATR